MTLFVFPARKLQAAKYAATLQWQLLFDPQSRGAFFQGHYGRWGGRHHEYWKYSLCIRPLFLQRGCNANRDWSLAILYFYVFLKYPMTFMKRLIWLMLPSRQSIQRHSYCQPIRTHTHTNTLSDTHAHTRTHAHTPTARDICIYIYIYIYLYLIRNIQAKKSQQSNVQDTFAERER